MDLRTDAKRLATSTTTQVQQAQECIEQLLENMKALQEERDQAVAKVNALLYENRACKTSPVPNPDFSKITSLSPDETLSTHTMYGIEELVDTPSPISPLVQNAQNAACDANPVKKSHRNVSTESWRTRNLSRALRARTLELRREKATSAELLEQLRSQEERHKRAMWKLKRLEERSQKLINQPFCRNCKSKLLVQSEATNLKCKSLAKEVQRLRTRNIELSGRAREREKLLETKVQMNRFHLKFLLRRIKRLEFLQKARISSRSFIRPIYRSLQGQRLGNCQVNCVRSTSRYLLQTVPADGSCKPMTGNRESCVSDLKSQNCPELKAKNRRISALRQELRAVTMSKDKTAQLAGLLAKTYDSLVIRSRASHRQAQRKDAVLSQIIACLVSVWNEISFFGKRFLNIKKNPDNLLSQLHEDFDLAFVSCGTEKWKQLASHHSDEPDHRVAQRFTGLLRRKLWALLDAYSSERSALRQSRCRAEEEQQRQSALVKSLRESLQLSQNRLKEVQSLTTKKDSENTALLEATQRLQAELDSQRIRLRVLLQERRLSTAQLQTLRATVDGLQVASQTAEEEKRTLQNSLSAQVKKYEGLLMNVCFAVSDCALEIFARSQDGDALDARAPSTRSSSALSSIDSGRVSENATKCAAGLLNLSEEAMSGLITLRTRLSALAPSGHPCLTDRSTAQAIVAALKWPKACQVRLEKNELCSQYLDEFRSILAALLKLDH
ncbi:hypothetical protein SprV_0902665800 [Sparganum proliferum]